MFAVVARDGHELVQDRAALPQTALAIPRTHCLDQFLPGCHAHLPRHVVVLRPDHPAGGTIREASALASRPAVAERMSQCGGQSWMSLDISRLRERVGVRVCAATLTPTPLPQAGEGNTWRAEIFLESTEPQSHRATGPQSHRGISI